MGLSIKYVFMVIDVTTNKGVSGLSNSDFSAIVPYEDDVAQTDIHASATIESRGAGLYCIPYTTVTIPSNVLYMAMTMANANYQFVPSRMGAASLRQLDVTRGTCPNQTQTTPYTINQTIILASTANPFDSFYKYQNIAIVAGTGIGQERRCLDYVGATRLMTVDRAWNVTPDSTTQYEIKNYTHILDLITTGYAQGAGTGNNQLQLKSSESSADSEFIGMRLQLRIGAGATQQRIIIAYNGSTKTVTIDRPWTVTPDNTTFYVILSDSGYLENSMIDSAVDFSTTQKNTLNTDFNALQTNFNSSMGAISASMALQNTLTSVGTNMATHSDALTIEAAIAAINSTLNTSVIDTTVLTSLASNTNYQAAKAGGLSKIDLNNTNANTALSGVLLDGFTLYGNMASGKILRLTSCTLRRMYTAYTSAAIQFADGTVIEDTIFTNDLYTGLQNMGGMVIFRRCDFKNVNIYASDAYGNGRHVFLDCTGIVNIIGAGYYDVFNFQGSITNDVTSAGFISAYGGEGVLTNNNIDYGAYPILWNGQNIYNYTGSVGASFSFPGYQGEYVQSFTNAESNINSNTNGQIASLNNLSETQAQAATAAALAAYNTTGVAKEASVLSIQNNTTFSCSLDPYLLIPTSGYNIYKVYVTLRDSTGKMIDPDIHSSTVYDMALTLFLSDGTNKNIMLNKDGTGTPWALDDSPFGAPWKVMMREAVGLYYCFVYVDPAEIPNQLVYKFHWNITEGGVTLQDYATRSNAMLSSVPGTMTLADNTANADIVAKALKARNVSGTSAVSGSIEKDILDWITTETSPLATETNATANKNTLAIDIQNIPLLTEANVRDAVGLASSNLDSQLNKVTRTTDTIDTGVTRDVKDKMDLSLSSGDILKNGNDYIYLDRNGTPLFTLEDNTSSRRRQ